MFFFHFGKKYCLGKELHFTLVASFILYTVYRSFFIYRFNYQYINVSRKVEFLTEITVCVPLLEFCLYYPPRESSLKNSPRGSCCLSAFFYFYHWLRFFNLPTNRGINLNDDDDEEKDGGAFFVLLKMFLFCWSFGHL